ncbi:hypothetical protein BFL38_10855 [Brachyspira hampsonii]|uniref:Uncharacterized protein n=1 Tax=Brachyspira hampsonii TaxID=1287055 RepID=A0A1E5NIC4_9SPIR|nr:hypothetical protein [Brachyspira hampsonii]OEJ15949.1 hypothetical protein BFL38_10855 [Brachyspira hampsonii]
MATHTSSGKGHSPYYVMSDAEAGEDDQQKYKDDIKTLNEKVYQWRDYSGYEATSPSSKTQINLEDWINSGYAGKSLILYTYSISDNGEKITVSQKEFQSSSINISKDYSLSKITSSEQAVYTNADGSSLYVKITESNSKKTISVDGNILDENFQDYGPIFVDRVRNARFEYNSKYLPAGNTYIPGIIGTMFGGTIEKIVYKFNADGTSFTLTYNYDGKEYKYENKLARFDSDAENTWTAKYESTPDGSMGAYTRVVLRNGSGTSNPGPDEIGTVIRSSMTLHGIDLSTDDPTSNLGLEMIGNIVQP